MEIKKTIRASVLMLRDGQSIEQRREKSHIIFEKVIATKEYSQAEVILIYVNFRSEVETEELILRALIEGKKVYCPKTNKENMDFYQIDSLDKLKKGFMGIQEPQADEKKRLTTEEIKRKKCLMVMPGSAFDKERNRIGYGRGYYDKYLDKISGIKTIALSFECQLVEKIPAKAYDIKPEAIVTEKSIYL